MPGPFKGFTKPNRAEETNDSADVFWSEIEDLVQFVNVVEARVTAIEQHLIAIEARLASKGI
jgi:hypothetical protein